MARVTSGMNMLDWLALVLLMIGGLNWGIIGLFELNLVERLLGGLPMLLRAVYVAVGAAGAYCLVRYLLDLAK